MRLAIIYIILCFSILIKAQNLKIDSLKKVISLEQKDTSYIKQCLSITEQYMLFNYDSAFLFLDLAESKVKERNNHFWLGQINRRRGNLFDRAGQFEKAKTLYKKAYAQAKQSIVEAENESMRYRSKRLLAACLSDLGSVAIGETNYIEGIEYYNEAIKLNTELKNKRGLSVNLGNRGIIYYKMGNYPVALKNYFAALKINDELNDNENRAINYINVGLVHKETGNRLAAIDYFKKSLDIYQLLNDKISISYSLGNLGIVYQDMKQYKLAEHYILKALEIDKFIGDLSGVTRHLGNLGIIAMENNNYSRAETFFDSAIYISRTNNYIDNLSRQLQNFGQLKLKQNKLVDAEKYFLESIELGSENNLINRVMDGNFALSRLYRKDGQYKKALYNYEQFILYRDSIYSEENARSNLREAMKYEYEKKAAADSVKASEEKKVVDAQLKQEKTQRLALYGGLGLVGIFALFMVNRFRVINQQKKLIEEQKKVVEAQKHLVEEKQKEIIDSIKYAKRIQTALITNEHYVNHNINRLMR